jgi:superfamily II DNA or RNA helicase
MMQVTLSNGYMFKAASTHILRTKGKDIFLSDLQIGDILDHRSDIPVFVTSIIETANEDCYDISIKNPYLYYDANGLVHHNTITNATLVHICEKYGRTITIVPNKSLVEQTEENFIVCGLDVGVFYGDRKDLTKTHTICTWQSLNVLDKNSHDSIEDKEKFLEFIKDIKTVIVDEVHMATASVLKKLLTENFANVPIRWGLTGTIPKKDFEYESLRASIGDVVNKISAKELQDKGILSNCHVNIVQTAEWKEFKDYQDELKFLVNDEARLNFIFTLIQPINDTGNTLVLVDRLESGKFLQAKFNEYYKSIGQDIEVPFISGVVKTKDRKTEYKEVATSNNKLIIATYGVASTGIDIPRIFNLVLLEPGKSFTRVIQSIGRGIRKAEDKDFVNIYDICASTKYSKQHLTKRKSFYKDAKYPFTIAKPKYI